MFISLLGIILLLLNFITSIRKKKVDTILKSVNNKKKIIILYIYTHTTFANKVLKLSLKIAETFKVIKVIAPLSLSMRIKYEFSFF